MVYMRKFMEEISKEEQRVLSKQLASSPIGKNPRPTKILDIYDFDSTLFLSPMLSQNIWDPTFINAITTENLMGPGWWRDKRSLSGIPDYSTFWNESVVESALTSCHDPNTMTVLLTGRRYYPFHDRMDQILRSRGLQFDLIGLRPDPDSDAPDHPKGLMFNEEPDIFATTMDFKTSFIIHTLHSHPMIEEVVMWDDRSSHICHFKPYLDDMVQRKVIKRGHLVCVKALRPKYNPTWELNMVESIISSHNSAIAEYRDAGRTVAPIVEMAHRQNMITSANTFGLIQIPYLTTLQCDKDALYETFEPIYSNELLLDTNVKTWERTNAEEPVFFGNQVLIGPYFDMAKSGSQYEIKCIARTKATFNGGLTLQVQVTSIAGEYLLPLWYRPSTFQNLLTNDYEWVPLEKELVLKGTVSTHQLLTVDTFERLGADSTEFVTF
ncbi:hypothetical protein K501DRAFT_287311 [Backusella circina FSU 941]|nr:hypothetical protein K501DRAFT_287311 [Backusella circina FSU 941]